MTNIQKKETSLAQTGKSARGFEAGYESGDLIMPRATLLQSKSPEVEENPRAFFAGDIINSITKEKLPEHFIPVFLLPPAWIRFNPRNQDDPNFSPEFDPGAMVWRSSDPLDPRVKAEGQFGANGEKPLATKFINFCCYFPKLRMPIIVSFAKTSFKAGKQLLSLTAFATNPETGEQLDMFARRYRLASKKEEKNKNTYHVLTVAPAGEAGDDYAYAEGLWEKYHDRTSEIKIHEEEREEQDPAEANTGRAPF